ncbi:MULTISPECIES: metal ABC transporter solute-binding protein, Zn/Mn family [Sutcliffiella]|uniref:metal ABC transporter solute-binding protein, Zn/Mn family n=1 Tax=Sutcliffiella TaxID=2837511 RepID=UPI000B254730|nr:MULTISPECIES: zinc ABC transporter substrate-binding protein [Sutcliffiella]MED4016063.1 zinc ABC transporter substrate-binding protein [Sutcliffiella cohnii]WBL14233.1 zinc ABC transporter substrate-binding protein [Sutcliffiella sp. NC1]
MNLIKKFLVISVVGCMLLFVGCSSNNTSSEERNEIHVTTTIAQIADVVKNVGGEKVKVESLMGPGIDPHAYNASQGDISKLSNADIIFYNGLNLEGKMGEIFKNMEKDKPTIAVAETIPAHLLLEDEEEAGMPDPHVWFDINLWIHVVEAIKEELIKLDNDNKEFYEKNADSYIAEITDLHEWAIEEIKSIPEESRVLITAHDAFQYFGSAYSIEVMGLQGLSTDAEYGLHDVRELIEVITTRNIKAVFVESSISDESIRSVVEGAKSRGHEVVIGGELYSDAMGDAGTEEGTYIGMFKHNIRTIVDALK